MKLTYVEMSQSTGVDGQVNANWRRVGSMGITKILLLCDGDGPMGHYDMIYLYKDNEEAHYAAMPAHNCVYWEVDDGA